jgi:hypothetical protein
MRLITFLHGGTLTRGRMEVALKIPSPSGDLNSGIPSAPAGLSWDGDASAGRAHEGLI